MANKKFIAIREHHKKQAKAWIDKQPKHIKKIIGEYISNYIVPQARASAYKEGYDKGASELAGAYQCKKHPKAINYVLCTFCYADKEAEIRADERAKCKNGTFTGKDVVEFKAEAYRKGYDEAYAKGKVDCQATYANLEDVYKTQFEAGYKKGQAELIEKLKDNLELCGWKASDDAVKDTLHSDYRRGQIDVFRWMEREIKKASESLGALGKDMPPSTSLGGGTKPEKPKKKQV